MLTHADFIASEMIATGSVPIGSLKRHDTFRFPLYDIVFIYRGRGWYKRENDRKCYRTGIKSAVLVVERYTAGSPISL